MRPVSSLKPATALRLPFHFVESKLLVRMKEPVAQSVPSPAEPHTPIIDPEKVEPSSELFDLLRKRLGLFPFPLAQQVFNKG